jgi:Uma2 family endonuclease
MGQPAVSALAPLPFELVYEDGEPLETYWHDLEHNLLRTLIRQIMVEQGRNDFFVGANMFVYYSVPQAQEVANEVRKGLEKRAFRGPDVFWVGNAKNRKRKCWIAWEEDGRLPDLIVELLSPSTADNDRKEKKDLYAQVFRTAEYFLYDPETKQLEGFRLVDRSYRSIPPDEKGRLWSGQLGGFLGLWHGIYQGTEDDWVRLFRPDGTLVPTEGEAGRQRAEAADQRAEAADQRAEAERQRAEAERQRAEAERQRAEAAEAELARLRASLEERRSND